MVISGIQAKMNKQKWKFFNDL